LAGGPAEQLTDDPADEFVPDLSPDGRAVTYHSWRTGTRDIEVKPLDGGPIEHVTATPAQESNPRWSPDGRVIAFTDLVPPPRLLATLREPRGWSTPTVLATNAAIPSWSPDGRSIAYVHVTGDVRSGSVMVVPETGGTARVVVDPTAPVPPAERVEWSPD